MKKINLRKMNNAGFELTTLNSRGCCSYHCAMEYFNLERLFSYLLTADIYNKVEHWQNRIKEIGTPCLSANSVKTWGVPIRVKA